jgi:DNA-binding transcriptional ArsR family regulator
MLPSTPDPSLDFEEFDLDDREIEVLKLLASGQNAHFSFQGLRRRLGLHQETLTRTLKRLEDARAIERSADGYTLKSPVSNFSFSVRTNPPVSKPIVEAYLPAQVDVTVLFQRLRGKWFGNFRWLGYSHDGNLLSMSWISDDGRMELQARINSDKITIGADTHGNQDQSEQMTAAYQLFDHITKIAEEMAQTASNPPAAAS